MIGTTLDKYEVLQKVGEGGMATVYRGRHVTLEREVAIKVLHPHLSSSARNRKRFAREARAIEQLHHRNILEIFDYSGIDCRECYIITEYVEGRTLTALLEERGRLPSELVALIGIELGQALGYAHEAGVLHRDLKPDNVMIRVDGTVKLMDFGIARFLDESHVTLTGALVGSPAFMSPEQAIEGELDPRSDLFSLGTVLFQLVTGQLPFTGANPSVILKKVIEGDRPHVSELAPSMSPSLADVIERLMATHPEARFPSAEACVEALRGCLEEVQIDPDDPAWSIVAFLDDPDGYEARLHARVSEVLLETGKEHIDRGETLTALRLFNRLLSMDEENEEVLELIRSLHAEPEPPRRRDPRPWAALAFLGVLLVAGAYALWPATPPPEQPVAPPTTPAVPEASPGLQMLHAPRPRPLVAPASSPSTDPASVAPSRPLPTRLAPAPPEDASPPTPPARGELRIRSRIPADVFHEGRKIGTTRLPIELDAGSYLLELRSDVIEPRQIRVDVGPGEVVQRDVMLETRPAIVHLAPSFDAACAVWLDGEAKGTAGDLEYRLAVPNPENVGHALRVVCPGQPPFEHTWSHVVLPGEVVRP